MQTLTTPPELVEQAIGFLRYRCSVLQSALYHDDPCAAALADEGGPASAWTDLFALFDDEPTRESLARLYACHGEVIGRLERGGVGDVSPSVEELVRAAIVDRLQALTDDAVRHITNPC